MVEHISSVLRTRAVDFQVSHACNYVDITMEEYRRNVMVLLTVGQDRPILGGVIEILIQLCQISFAQSA